MTTIFFQGLEIASAKSPNSSKSSAVKQSPILVFVHGGAWVGGSGKLNRGRLSIDNHKCNPDSIYLIGHSAGAHLIGLWATKNQASASPGLQPFLSTAPMPLLHSENDELVNVEQSTSFVAQLEKQKRRVAFNRLKSGLHFNVAKSPDDPK